MASGTIFMTVSAKFGISRSDIRDTYNITMGGRPNVC